MSGLEVYQSYDLNPGNYMANIGDVQVYEKVLVTPVGTWPLAGAHFLISHQPAVIRKTSATGTVVAIVCGVLALLTFWWTCGLGLLFLLGLFFLMDKEEILSGPAIIVIRSGGQVYQAQEMLKAPSQLPWLVNKVNYCQALAFRA